MYKKRIWKVADSLRLNEKKTKCRRLWLMIIVAAFRDSFDWRQHYHYHYMFSHNDYVFVYNDDNNNDVMMLFKINLMMLIMWKYVEIPASK